MVTQTTLADLLIEAGFEPEAALRASELLEQDLSDLARRSEVNLRFDRVDEQFAAQDRASHTQFDAVNRDIKALDTRIDDLKDSTERELRGVNLRIDDLKDSTERELQGVNQRIDDLKDSTERESRGLGQRITDLRHEMIGRFTEHKDGVEQSIAQLKEHLEAKIDNQGALLRSEIESLRREHRTTRWVLGLLIAATFSGFGVVIALLVELLNR